MKSSERSVPPTTALRALACLALVAAPHLLNVKIWAVALLGCLIAYRALCLLRGWQLPPQWLRIVLVVVAFGAVMMTYGRINGQNAGVALLLVMTGLKLTESRSQRDWEVVLNLSYFLLITHFLFSQSLFMLLFMLAGVLLITASLADLSHRQAAMPLRDTLRVSGRLVLHALPVMAILFVLFPRIPGPLWGLPSDAGAARSGLSDVMSPGSIGNLIQNDAVAFRVRFDRQPPDNNMLYWRAHVFYNFDGRTWHEGGPNGVHRNVPSPNLPLTHYEITLEPHRQPWLFGLDLIASGPDDAVFSPNHQMWVKEPVKERRLYRASSYITDTINEPLDWITQRRSLHLPSGGNRRARELGEVWQQQFSNPADIVNAALQRFRNEPFHYTLQPPELGASPVDQFLFETRAGFCEHYASAFVVLMRAAGIPARVVTGYQGGELNDMADYMIVRQSDAHAWAEVWLEGRGWVRIDPTAAVAPERVELGLAAALSASEVPLGLMRRNNVRYFLEMNWDMINASWNRWVLAYGPELQQSFLARFGLIDWYRMTLALTALIMVVLGLLGLAIIRQARPAQNTDPVQQSWLKLCQRLEKIGMQRRPQEGPRDFARRVARRYPALGAELRPLAEQYIRLRYGRDSSAPAGSEIQALRRAVSALRIETG